MRSNSYTLGFTTLVTIILGIMLSSAATLLKDRQQLNMELDIKKNILRALDISGQTDVKLTAEDYQQMFSENIRSYVIDKTGQRVNTMKPEDIDPKTMSGLYSVFEKVIDNQTAGYAIPISGKGLWSTIYGYLALESDCKTVMGITFYKHGETPGLGGEIEKDWFTFNFVGKQIFDPSGKLVSIQIVKRTVDESRAEAYHQVDGISGATLTTKGMNIFIEQDLKNYLPFFKLTHQMEEG